MPHPKLIVRHVDSLKMPHQVCLMVTSCLSGLDLDVCRQFSYWNSPYVPETSDNHAGIPSPRTGALPAAHRYPRVSPAFSLRLFLTYNLVSRVAIWKSSNPIIYLTAMILAMHSGASLHRSSFNFHQRQGTKMRHSRLRSTDRSTFAVPVPFGILSKSLDPVVLGFRPRLQGLRGTRPSNTPSFNVHRDHSRLCTPSHCNACWASAPTTNAFIWSLAHALSTSTVSAGGKY